MNLKNKNLIHWQSSKTSGHLWPLEPSQKVGSLNNIIKVFTWHIVVMWWKISPEVTWETIKINKRCCKEKKIPQKWWVLDEILIVCAVFALLFTFKYKKHIYPCILPIPFPQSFLGLLMRWCVNAVSKHKRHLLSVITYSNSKNYVTNNIKLKYLKLTVELVNKNNELPSHSEWYLWSPSCY